MNKFICLLSILLVSAHACLAQTKGNPIVKNDVITGAERTEVYFPMLLGKKVAVFANHTSMVGKKHLVDTLLSSGIEVIKIFGPEHGFRGTADAGEKVINQKDEKTGLPIISLYGDHKKPGSKELADVDVIVFDIQDVGVRFYTYISSLQYIMEAALENHKPLLILDRPNPNGFYVDGPILDRSFKSFVGLQPIPVVYGMTIGEYALMLTGENWLSEKSNAINAQNIQTEPTPDTPFHIQVIKCRNYDHNTLYKLPVFPSPNLKDMGAVYLYPSTCFFEGTVISEGRGTDKPFRIFGHPDLPKSLYSFVPKPNAGAKTGKHFQKTCYGWEINGSDDEIIQQLQGQINLSYLIKTYEVFPVKDSFFLSNGFFNKLAGTDELMRQIRNNVDESEIRNSWKKNIQTFMDIRRKYLLYPDF